MVGAIGLFIVSLSVTMSLIEIRVRQKKILIHWLIEY